MEGIKHLITSDDIKNYMERFRSVANGDNGYIPFRVDMVKCPASILAMLGKKQINIFTFHTMKRQLILHKRLGIEGPIINILHSGNHFVRLYNLMQNTEHYGSLAQCETILGNYNAYIRH